MCFWDLLSFLSVILINKWIFIQSLYWDVSKSFYYSVILLDFTAMKGFYFSCSYYWWLVVDFQIWQKMNQTDGLFYLWVITTSLFERGAPTGVYKPHLVTCLEFNTSFLLLDNFVLQFNICITTVVFGIELWWIIWCIGCCQRFEDLGDHLLFYVYGS